MSRKFVETAVLTAALSVSMAAAAQAGVIYAPGVNVNSNAPTAETQADPSGQGNAESQAPAESSSTSAAPSAANTGNTYTTISGGVATNGSSSGANVIIAPGISTGSSSQLPSSAGTTVGSGTSVSGGNIIVPGTVSQTAGTTQTTANTDLSKSASNVTTDPIMGQVPFLHVQLLQSSGNLTEGFTTNMGAFNSPDDGFTGLKLRFENSIGDIYYRVYTEQHGWSKWAMNEMITPYSGDGARVTAFQIRGNGHTRNLYDIYYRAVLNDGTVLGWAHDGQSAGTIGTGKYIQQVQVALWPKGTAFSQSTDGHFSAQNDESVYVGADGAYHYQTWNGAAYTGWAYDTDNNKYYFKDSNVVTGWQYIDGYKYYFDAQGRVVTDLEPIIGLQSNYIIKVNKTMKTMTVYAKDGDNGYIMPVKVILNTIGPDTPVGTFKTYEKYRWKFMHDDIYCQYLLRFKNGFILHSIIYQPQPTSYNLVASTYNYLGKNQSDGCVRMTSGDAAWVYTNCGVGTQITIYNDEWTPGPFDRPAIQKGIPFNQNYDPTDPVIVAKQKADAAAAAQAQAEAATGAEAPPTEVAAQ